jgi:hypothetical protein
MAVRGLMNLALCAATGVLFSQFAVGAEAVQTTENDSNKLSSPAESRGESANSTGVSAGLPVGPAGAQHGISSLNLPGFFKRITPSALGADFYVETDAYPQKLQDKGSGAVGLQFFAGPTYKLSDATTLYVRQQWATSYTPSTAAQGSKTNTHMGDTILGVVNTSLLKWGSTGSLTGIGRIYLPTGETSRANHQNGMLYARTIAAQNFGSKLVLSFQTINEYMIQPNKTVLSDGKPTGTARAETTPFLNAAVNLAKHLDYSQSVGLDYNWVRGDKTVGVDSKGTTQLYIDSYLSTDVFPKLTLILGATNEPTLNNGTKFQAFRDSEYYFYSILLASI